MFTFAKSNTPLVSVTKPVELSILTWHISSLANNRLIVPDLAHKNSSSSFINTRSLWSAAVDFCQLK